jgi:hypothetical protein
MPRLTRYVRGALPTRGIFFNRGKAQKGLVLHWTDRRWSYKMWTGHIKKQNYNTVLQISTKDPEKSRRKAIRFLISINGTGTPPPAALIATGDWTTWGKKNVWCRQESLEGPPHRRLSWCQLRHLERPPYRPEIMVANHGHHVLISKLQPWLSLQPHKTAIRCIVVRPPPVATTPTKRRRHNHTAGPTRVVTSRGLINGVASRSPSRRFRLQPQELRDEKKNHQRAPDPARRTHRLPPSIELTRHRGKTQAPRPKPNNCCTGTGPSPSSTPATAGERGEGPNGPDLGRSEAEGMRVELGRRSGGIWSRVVHSQRLIHPQSKCKNKFTSRRS